MEQIKYTEQLDRSTTGKRLWYFQAIDLVLHLSLRGCGSFLPLQNFISDIYYSGLSLLSLSQHRNLCEGHTLLLWHELCLIT